MKKTLFILSALLFSFAATFTLVSCGDDDDEPKVQTTSECKYTITFSQDLLDAANVFISYKGDNGRAIMEAVTTTTWSKTVTTSNFPAEYGVQFKFSMKNMSELTKDKYNLTCDLMMQMQNRGGNTAQFSNSTTILGSSDVAKDKVERTLNSADGKIVGYRFSKDGVPTSYNDMKFQ